MPDDGPLRLHLTSLPDRLLLVLDPVQRRVTLAGQDCAISGRAFDLLRALAALPGQPIRPQSLLASVWPGRVVVAANLRAQVQVLRRALGMAAVQSLGDRGYALQAEPAMPTAGPAGPAHLAGPASPASAWPQADAPLYGRDDDLAALLAMLRSQRLVSVTGPLGVGKSRLARRALAALADDRGAVVASVDLSALPGHADTAALARAVLAAWPSAADAPNAADAADAADAARAPDAPDAPDAPAQAGVAPAGANGQRRQHWQRWPGLQGRHGWLLLDNAEHLVAIPDAPTSPAGAPGPLPGLVQSLLAADPGLRLLVSTQRPLGLAGEALHRLAPLPLPDPAAAPEVIRANPAVRLLLSRASAADQRFTLAEDDGPAAAAIVHRLDGLPLAIGLAGAQLPLLGAAALAQQLEDPLRLLGPGQRGRLGRPGTLREAVARSVNRLPADAQVALVALAMIESPFPLASACAVLQAIGRPAADAQAMVHNLVDRSLLLPAQPAGHRLLAVHRAWALQALPTLPDATQGLIAAAAQRLARPQAATPSGGPSGRTKPSPR